MTTYFYDSPDSNTFLTQQNLAGRLAKITHAFGSVERFSYTVAGRITAKTLSPADALPFIGTFTYNNEGQMTGYTPSGIYNSSGTAIPQGNRQWTYDALGRPLGLNYYNANNTSTALTGNAAYNPAGQLTSYARSAVLQYNAGNDLAGFDQTETMNFFYNTLGQLTQQSGGAWAPTIQYQYSATANDGRLQSRIDQYAGGSASTSSYAYDSLGRLTSASSTGGIVWGQSYVYDPFGNLLQQNVTSGSAPALNVTVDSTTNRVTTAGFAYDVAGNLVQSPTGSSPSVFSYDSQNRMTRASYAGGAAINYYYGANGERLYDGAHWHFYGPDGTHLETLTKNAAGGTFGSTVEELHFAGWLVFQDYYPVVTDRLGSVVQMGKGNGAINQGSYPYGQAISGLPQPTNSAPPNYGSVVYPSSGSVSDVAFGTYHRDGYGLDYALNRYYDPARTRFTSPDPYVGSGGLSGDSWNRYSYTRGDPVNYNDPEGLVGRPAMQAPERGRRPAQSSGSATFFPGRGGAERGPITTPYTWGPLSPPPVQRLVPLDPLPLSRTELVASGKKLSEAVNNGSESDCEALADFADNAAIGGVTARRFKEAFTILTPSQFPVGLVPGVRGSGGTFLVTLNANQTASGFASYYQDQIPTADQSHHFAAFFQLGFAAGAATGAFVANAWEILELTPGNGGDIALGTAAASLGADLRAGTITPEDIGAAIRSTLCNH